MPSKKISPDEVNARVLAGEPVVFVDSRNAEAWGKSDRKIPGAIRATAEDAESHVSGIDRNATVIAYCCCPNEESSMKVAQVLGQKGYARVFALRGGFDAWVAAGYPVEEKAKAA
jgi:rhodanese-related sulfurtransferase